MSTSASDSRRSIAQVNRILRCIIEAETLEQFFWVGGRIDRLYTSDFGHVYFDLVDDNSRIRCMVREEQAANSPIEFRNHLDIEVYGDIQYYEPRAEAQIMVLDMRIADESTGTAPAVERLRVEGLYPPAKQPPPATIRRIGIITSRSSRAIGDFESAYQSAGERGVLAPAEWAYVLLEGDRALQSIVDAIVSLDTNPEIDAIAIIRGGGRSENLATFETYEIARAVIQCGTYIVTGIGHHRDSTLVDKVADYAASTPTAVAHFIAKLCLRSLPSTPANIARDVAVQVNQRAKLDKRESRSIAKGEEAPSSRGVFEPSPKPSRASNALVVTLLLLTAASIAFLVAAMIIRLQ
jgi:exodeoxyribonuclease VII large subunit